VMETVSIAAAVEQAARAALANIPIADPLVVGAAVTTPPAADTPPFHGVAVSARFTGSRTGEVLIAVEQSVADALQNSPLGPLDIAAALAPALTAAANTVSTVVTGPGQALFPGPALDALFSKPHAALVPLMHDDVVRALVGLVINLDEPAPAAEPSAPNYPTKDELARSKENTSPTAGRAPVGFANNGLDMLRDVAMDVTAQIGSTRMTVSELLNLTDGAVIELDRAAGAPADLLVNGHLIARGEVVVIDENFGLRITEIVSDDNAATARS
jgi:flagellar motor switch protein FliN/FliY